MPTPSMSGFVACTSRMRRMSGGRRLLLLLVHSCSTLRDHGLWHLTGVYATRRVEALIL